MGLEQIGYFRQEEWSFEGRETFGRKIYLHRGMEKGRNGWSTTFMFVTKIVKNLQNI